MWPSPIVNPIISGGAAFLFSRFYQRAKSAAGLHGFHDRLDGAKSDITMTWSSAGLPANADNNW
jgi:hypothetical protein